MLRATPRVGDDLQSVGLVAAAVLVGAGTASIHGSGFLAVYIAGLLVADTWQEQDGSYHVAANAASAIAEPLIFGLLGAAFAAQVGWDELAYGIALTAATVFLVRPIVAAAGTDGQRAHAEESVRSSPGAASRERFRCSSPPTRRSTTSKARRRCEGTVLVATAASILLQGATLGAVARRTVGARAEARAPTRDSD